VPRASVVADLRRVLAEQDFRRLFATRLISQAGDGVFTAGVGTYVFFSSTTFPNPASAALAFAVLYLPYSLIGPFAGVFIDRWSRRQVLVWSALARSVFVALTALLVASGSLGIALFAAVLAVNGGGRFFNSSLSAALPHVVAEDELVMANSMSVTVGGLMTAVGGLAGLGVRLVAGASRGESTATVLAGGCCYLVASTVAAAMRRDLLGPAGEGARRRRGVLSELGAVAAGLGAGARYVSHRRSAAAALGATGGNRLLYGVLFLMSILLYRNYFYRSAGATVALANFTELVIAGSVGYACAALVTPAATRRLAKPWWIVALLAAGAIVTGTLGVTFSPVAYLVVGFALNLTSQGIAISVTTILQEEVDDAYRGRVFSFYDVFFNVTYVAGAALSALFMPVDGKSYAILGLVAAGYAAAAAGYRVASAHTSGGASGPLAAAAPPSADDEAATPEPGAAVPPGSPASPSASAQRRNS
jgi:MFS family permease